MRFLTIDELIYINEQLPSSDQIHKILKGKQRVRDTGLLEAAWGRPMQTVFGADAYPTLPEKAAALLHSLARNHPFADGNKRTATIAALFMLRVNGLGVTWNAAEALDKIVAVAEGKLAVADFAAWLPVRPCPPSPEPDAESDERVIAGIIHEHHWLLDTLAQR
ncbi:MAG TPA: type II toxin-antitoxin system death-on-curing family toxin [Phototrophicaceae bacterium]|nr:type II toxin-antitoxin system death-on-curing family toxin [Phototrophicaceae bacterium]